MSPTKRSITSELATVLVRINSAFVLTVLSTQRFFVTLSIFIVSIISALYFQDWIHQNITDEAFRLQLIEANHWKTVRKSLQHISIPTSDAKLIDEPLVGVQRAVQVSVYEVLEAIDNLGLVTVNKVQITPSVQIPQQQKSNPVDHLELTRVAVEVVLKANGLISTILTALEMIGGQWPVEIRACRLAAAEDSPLQFANAGEVECVLDVYHTSIPIEMGFSEPTEGSKNTNLESLLASTELPSPFEVDAVENSIAVDSSRHHTELKSQLGNSKNSFEFTGSVSSPGGTQIFLNGLPLQAYPWIRSGAYSTDLSELIIRLKNGQTVKYGMDYTDAN